MFEKKALVFYYCTTPLHMGAGSSVGAIDNPIQREIHSNQPIIVGSGLKGAVRHHVSRLWKSEDIVPLFGSESNDSSLTAGAISFTDANVVAFPVRSLKNTFVYITCPYALARLKRFAQLANIPCDWNVEAIGKKEDNESAASSTNSIDDKKLCLEAYELTSETNQTLTAAAKWVSANCLPDTPENKYFKEKVEKDFFLVSDNVFNFFAEQATVVEPHVAIDEATGTAKDGALFYTENLPPESILAGIILASVERKGKKDESAQRMTADECLEKALYKPQGINGQLIQMGGDSTTGRGLVLINAVKGA